MTLRVSSEGMARLSLHNCCALEPPWGHVGHIFGKNEATLWDARLFFVGSLFFFDFWVVLALFGKGLAGVWQGGPSIHA